MTDRRRPGDTAAIARSAEAKAIHPSGSSFWIAWSRSLSSGAHARDLLARNDIGEHRSRMERSEIRDSRDVDPGFSRSLPSGGHARDLLARNDIGEHRSPDGAKRNPGLTRRRPRISLRFIRATAA